MEKALANPQYNYKKGLGAMAVCYLIWGFQSLYWALDSGMDTSFLLACRIIWASVCCLVILAIQGKLKALADIFKDKKVLMREIPASLLLFADWAIYLFAVRQGKIMECSMGYYIMPLVMFTFGAVVFKEKITWKHIVILAIVIVGIIISANGFGGFPYVTILLSLCFAVYSALKKSLTIDSIAGTTAEILMMAPLALIYILVFCRNDSGLLGLTFARQLFLIGSGIVTGLPMVFFAIGVRYLPLTLTGMLQYVSPTLGLVCSLILGESLSTVKLISFGFIWLGMLLYILVEFKGNKASDKEKA